MPASTKTSAEKYGMNIRPLHPDVQAEFRRQARIRGLTQAQYLAALMALAEDVRRVAQVGDKADPGVVANILRNHGLERVTA